MAVNTGREFQTTIKDKAFDKITLFSRLLDRSSAARGLFFFVGVPTILATFYYMLVASDIYVTTSEFSVNVEGHGPSAGGGLSMIMPAIGASANMHESMVVVHYIKSPTIVDKLEKKVNLRQIFSHGNADILSRVSESESRESFLESYNDMVQPVLDEQSGIVNLRVRAFTPEDSQKLAVAILDSAEDFVNGMAARMQEDSVEFSKNQLSKAEENVIDVNGQMKVFRNDNNSFDPTASAQSVMKIVTSLEGELAKVSSEIANYKNFMRSDSPKIETLEGQAASIRQQIELQNARLASGKGSKLADLTQDYETLTLKKAFANKRYEVLMSSFEAAQAEARKKSKYLLRIVEPDLPQEAVEPKRLKEIFTVFISCLIVYTLGTLIIAAIKDHLRI